jgi:hypothetical protein
MIEIERRLDGDLRTHRVYTKAEADEAGIPYLDWRLAREGEWVISDDDYVCECHRVYKIVKERVITFQFTLTYCRKWLSRDRQTGSVKGDPELHAEDYLDVGEAFYRSSPGTWVEGELRQSRAKRAISLYATLFIATEGQLGQREWDLIAQAYRPHNDQRIAVARKFFKHELVRETAMNEVVKLLNKAGVTKESVVENLEALREQAEASGKLNTAYRILEKQMEMLRMDQYWEGAPMKDRKQLSGDVEDADYEILGGISDNLDQLEAGKPPENRNKSAPEESDD